MSGSSKNMLTTMFQLSNQPFYKSAVPMDLDILDKAVYVDFCQRMFRGEKKDIDTAAVAFTYDLFYGETYLMQETMKEAFQAASEGSIVTKDDMVATVKKILLHKDNDFRDILNRLDNKKERNTLFCIATEGIASGLTRSFIMKRYDLDNASSVQNALENLGENKLNLIVRIAKGTYILQDRLFELWIAEKGGYLNLKLEQAEARHERLRAILQQIPEIPSPQR